MHSHILAANYIPFQYQLSIQQYILCTGIRAYEEDVDIQMHDSIVCKLPIGNSYVISIASADLLGSIQLVLPL